jgi:hypothetical protein
MVFAAIVVVVPAETTRSATVLCGQLDSGLLPVKVNQDLLAVDCEQVIAAWGCGALHSLQLRLVMLLTLHVLTRVLRSVDNDVELSWSRWTWANLIPVLLRDHFHLLKEEVNRVSNLIKFENSKTEKLTNRWFFIAFMRTAYREVSPFPPPEEQSFAKTV